MTGIRPWRKPNGCLPPPANRKHYGLFPAEATSTCTPTPARNMRIEYWIFLGGICASGIKIGQFAGMYAVAENIALIRLIVAAQCATLIGALLDTCRDDTCHAHIR